MSKQDGVYARTAASLEQKHNYGKRFAEVLGIVDDTRTKVVTVESSLADVDKRVAAAESEIKELPGKISLTVKNGSIGNTASIVLRVGDKEFPGTINLTGAVTFNDLKTSGETNINGSNITTGTIKSKNYSYTSGDDFATSGTAIDLENGIIRSQNFAIDEDGNADFRGKITADAGSKIGPWTFGDGCIVGMQPSTHTYHVLNPQDSEKMSLMHVSIGNFILDGKHIEVKSKVTWDDETPLTNNGAWKVDALGEYLDTLILYGEPTEWSHDIAWERLAALGGKTTCLRLGNTMLTEEQLVKLLALIS